MSSQSNPLSASERIQRAMGTTNPHICEKCGSEHFYRAEFRQFAQGRYSSAPGGDIQPMGEMPLEVLICICGFPVMPNVGGIRGGRTAPKEVMGFLDSLAKARRFLVSQDAPAVSKSEVMTLVEDSVGGYVPRAELDAVVERLGQLEMANASLSGLLQSATAPPPADAPAKPRGK